MKARNSMALMLARLLSLAVSFFSQRFFLQWLGEERYALYTFGVGFYLFISLVDVGFSVGAQKRMTEAFHRGDDDGAWRIHRTQMFLGLLAIAGGYAIYAAIGMTLGVEGVAREESRAVFLWLGLQFAASWFGLYLAGVLAARDRFRLVGLMNFLVPFGGAVGALVWTYQTRSVVGLAAGYGVGSLAGLTLFIVWLKRADPAFRFRPEFDGPIAADVARLGLSNYPNRAIGTFANRSDRQIIFAYRPAWNAFYALVNRPVEILYELLGATIDTLTPEITRAAADGPVKASEVAHRNSLIVWLAGCSFIVVPCAFGEAIVTAWLGRSLFEYQGAVMLMMALNYASELHYRALGALFAARGQLYRTAVFPLVNALATLFLTLWIVRDYGLLGVGVMNAALALVQLYPRIAVMRGQTEGRFPVGRHFARSVGILAVASALAALGYSLAGALSPWIALPLAPALAAICFVACVALRLSPPPSFMQQRWPALFG